MRQLVLAFVALVIGAWFTDSASAQPAATRGRTMPQPSSSAPAWKAAPANPYSRLFAPAVPLTPATPATSTSGPAKAPIVKCGMTLIPGDASVDPGMAAPPTDRSTRFAIRGVEPSICR